MRPQEERRQALSAWQAEADAGIEGAGVAGVAGVATEGHSGSSGATSFAGGISRRGKVTLDIRLETSVLHLLTHLMKQGSPNSHMTPYIREGYP